MNVRKFNVLLSDILLQSACTSEILLRKLIERHESFVANWKAQFVLKDKIGKGRFRKCEGVKIDNVKKNRGWYLVQDFFMI